MESGKVSAGRYQVNDIHEYGGYVFVQVKMEWGEMEVLVDVAWEMEMVVGHGQVNKGKLAGELALRPRGTPVQGRYIRVILP